MLKFNLVVGVIITTLSLSSCTTDYGLYSTKKLCIDYLNSGPLSLTKERKMAEIESRGVSTCAPYEAEAQIIKESNSVDTGNDFKKLSDILREAAESRKCTRWTFHENGTKQCVN
jgi:hypothetical protein